MPFNHRRDCPVCSKQDLANLPDHLSQVHGLSNEERQRYLRMATQRLHYPEEKEACSFKIPLKRRHPLERSELKRETALNEVTSYTEFCFKHPFSMLVVGPTQSGKTYFVEQMLTSPHLMDFPPKKEVQVTWFYNQWQPRYKKLKKTLGPQITFEQGLPDLSDDLREINPKNHHVLVFDDLMSQAVDSPILSRLFTQGRHRNASVILLMQNMFPKGKYNTDISRNAQYLVLFRSPSDRKQVNIMAERIFAKDRPKFMQVYSKATQVPYGYVLIDNQPCTAPEYQVVTDVFRQCQRHPISGTTHPPMKRLCVRQPMKRLNVSELEDQREREVHEGENSEWFEELREESEQSDPEESKVEDLQEENEEWDVIEEYSEPNERKSDYSTLTPLSTLTPEEKKAAIQYYLSFPEMERMIIAAQFNENPEYKRSAVWYCNHS